MTVQPRDLERVEELYERGLYLQAFRLAEDHGPLRDWRGTKARLLAGCLAMQLGAPRLGMAIHLRAWRADPAHPRARLQARYAVGQQRGPWEAWRFGKENGLPPEASEEHRSRFLSFEAQILAIMRDFDAAEERLAAAEALTPDDSPVHVCRAFVLHQQDRHEASLIAAQKGRAVDPGSPQAAMAVSHALTALGRDDEALHLLERTAREMESGRVGFLLASLQSANRDYQGALASLDRVVELSPLVEKHLAQAIAAQRSEAHYNCGHFEAAIRYARDVDSPFFREVADRMRDAPDGQRIALDVEFVKQDDRTCAPATLTAISRFWSREAEHLEVAEEICYDGTPSHSERRWAESNDWAVREFTVTWEAAKALIDRGIPFTLATVGATEGHLQAVVGYDERRGTFVVRDPSCRNEVEYGASSLLETARETGPRGMAMVPVEEAALLDDLPLPDTDLWNQSHVIQLALEAHDRAEAHEVYRAMSTQDPEHILTQYARRALAAYDGDLVGLLAFADSMLQRFPQSPRLLMSKLACLSDLGRDGECLELLEQVCGGGCNEPSLLIAYAGELTKDGRRHGDARRALRRVLGGGYIDPACLSAFGDLEWSAERFDGAVELYRFASCLRDKDDGLALRYFTAACFLDHKKDAEAFLEQRARRYASQSAGPLLTLSHAYRQTGQNARSLAVLEQALDQHPDDASLKVAASRIFGRHGQLDQAEEMLAVAESGAKRTVWLRAAAALAELRGDLPRALELWRESLEIGPLAEDANAELARLLAILEGPRVAVEHLDAVCARFPQNLNLQKMRVEWLSERDQAAAEPALRAMIAASSVNTWARLRLAWLLGERGELPEAVAEAELAALLDPQDSACRSVLGRLHTLAGRRADAAEAYRRAIRLSVQSPAAIQGLLAVCCEDDERRDAIALLRAEILRQPMAGDAPGIYRGYARGLLDAEELLVSLEELRRTRPDHRQCWSTTIQQLVSMDRLDEARRLGDRFIERFPGEIEPLLEVARLRCAIDDPEGERDALRLVLRIDPGLGQAHRRLAEIEELAGAPGEAKRLLEQAIDADPLDALNLGRLAELLWKMEEHDAALTLAERALGLEPDYDQLWPELRAWAIELGQPERAVEFARVLTKRRPGEARVRIRLADLLEDDGAIEESLANLEGALELDPRSIEASDRRARILAMAGRYEEALRACRSDVWQDEPPLPLRGRAAWVEAEHGNLQRAIEQMYSILEKAPDYAWGWRQLTEWHRNERDGMRYLDAAIHLARLTPDDPVSLGILGHARLNHDDGEGAAREFHRALELNPGYTFAGTQLLDLQLRGRDLEAAARTIRRLTPHVAPATAHAMQVCFDSASGDCDAALTGLRELLLMKDAEEDDLQHACEVAHSCWPSTVNALFEELIDHSDAHPLVGELWVKTRPISRLSADYRKWIRERDPGQEIVRRATGRLLERLAETQQTGRLKKFVDNHRSVIWQDTLLWGTALYVLTKVGESSFLVRWADQWQSRTDLEPWMLSNLATALRNEGRFDEGLRASMRAVMLAPDSSMNRHHAWLAVEEAIRGEGPVAETWLSRLPAESSESWVRFLARLARAVLESMNSDGDPGHTRFKRAWRLLTEARVEVAGYHRQAALRDVYRRSVRCIGRRRSGIGGVVWFWRWVRG